jgi:hypothetical protein
VSNSSASSSSRSDVNGVSERTEVLLLNIGDSLGVADTVDGDSSCRARHLVMRVIVKDED